VASSAQLGRLILQNALWVRAPTAFSDFLCLHTVALGASVEELQVWQGRFPSFSAPLPGSAKAYRFTKVGRGTGRGAKQREHATAPREISQGESPADVRINYPCLARVFRFLIGSSVTFPSWALSQPNPMRLPLSRPMCAGEFLPYLRPPAFTSLNSPCSTRTYPV
jgi:hypothetical protein